MSRAAMYQGMFCAYVLVFTQLCTLLYCMCTLQLYIRLLSFQQSLRFRNSSLLLIIIVTQFEPPM